MNGTVNPASGGDERHGEPHGAGSLPPEVAPLSATTGLVYLTLVLTDEPLTYAGLANRLDVPESAVERGVRDLRALCAPWKDTDSDRRLAKHRREEVTDRLEALTGTRPDVDDGDG